MGATYFFRDLHTLKMIPSHIIPAILKNRGEKEEINIWSAGCSNGSEPYTVALILKEELKAEIFDRVKIYATDIDPDCRFMGIVLRGSYPAEKLRRIPDGIFMKYFVEDPDFPGNFMISGDIREHVLYMWHDLNTLKSPEDMDFDIIICKNVLIHFKKQDSIDILGMFYWYLRKDGFLITEQTQKIPPGMEGMFQQITSSAQIHRKICNE